jgi:GPH family glycoside/pentoside/hexuronide:cation symporter
MKHISSKLPTSLKLAYAMPAFAMAVVGIPVYVYLPKFYTDVVGVHIAVVGYLLFGVRIFDAVTDPMIGWWSDRHRSIMGRRRPFILLGALLLAVSLYFLFTPPVPSTTAVKTLWFAICIYTMFFFWTMTAVPYESLGPELTRDYDDRTSLFAMRDGFLLAGTLVAASAPTLIKAVWGLGSDSNGERQTFFLMALLYAPMLIAACAWCVYRLREPTTTPADSRQRLWENFRMIRQNKPFMILLAAFTLSAIGSNLPATLILYYVQYVLHSDLADVMLLLYLATGILFLPGWLKLAYRIGKKKAWLWSMAINTGSFGGVFFLGSGDILAYGILVFLSGIGLGATLALPSAIQADVIDYDELLTRQRREGQYIGLWSVAKKMAAAAGIGMGLFVLGLAGYQPNMEQSPQVVLTLRILYALVPSVCNLVAICIALAYPITGEVHSQIQSAIDRRKNGQAVRDPLQPEMIRA